MNRFSRLKTLFKALPAILMLVAGLLASPGMAQDIMITGIIDGPLTGGVPKAIEIYVANDIADLSNYGVGSANNGGGSDGEEFTFPAVAASAGDFIYVASEATGFTSFFGFAPDYTTGAMAITGDDAVELFANGSVVDVFGDIDNDGSGQPWEYLDGWAYRNNSTGPDGTIFTLLNWTFSGTNALDGETTNDTAATAFPLGSYGMEVPDELPSVRSTMPANGAGDVAEGADIDIIFSEAVNVLGTWFDIFCNGSGIHTGSVSTSDNTSYRINPDANFVAADSCIVTVFATQVEDQDGSPDNMAAHFNFSFEIAAPPPPEAPSVSGTTPTSDATPTWSWSTGGGNGSYRLKLDDSDLSTGATEIKNTSYTPSIALLDGLHTLYVQEQDDADNWSESGSFAITINSLLDSDGDGMTDAFELVHGLDPLDNTDAENDADNDGLTNLDEFNSGTNPTLSDTDNDGMSDGYEVDNGFDPIDGSDCPTWMCGSNNIWLYKLIRY